MQQGEAADHCGTGRIRRSRSGIAAPVGRRRHHAEQAGSTTLHIKVGEKLKFIGTPGTVKDRMAVQITEIVQEGVEEEYDE